MLVGLLGGIGANHDSVEDVRNLVSGNVCPTGMFADRCLVDSLVDAHGADAAVRLLHNVAANPSNLVGHLFIADLRRPSCCIVKVGDTGKGAAAAYDVKLHANFLQTRQPECRRASGLF